MKFVVSTLALAAVASAHTTFQYFQVGGNDYGAEYVRRPPNNDPVTNVDSAVMGCNVGGSTAKPMKATVPAGSTFTAEFHHDSRASQGVDPSHKGPTMAYMAKVDDATKASDAGLNWFKIYEEGLAGGTWAVDKMNANGGKFSFKIPENIENGDYLLRPETIGLHAAGSYPGAQLYFGCAQITVTGAKGGSPPTVKFPGAYKGADPGIRVNIYTGLTGGSGYVIPGPRPYSDNGSIPATAAPPVPTVEAPAQTAPAPAGPGAPLWGQCGGTSWTGPTHCTEGTCKANGEHYSQCVP